MKPKRVSMNGKLYQIGTADINRSYVVVSEVEPVEACDPQALALADVTGRPTMLDRLYPIFEAERRAVLLHCGPKFSRSEAYQRAYRVARNWSEGAE